MEERAPAPRRRAAATWSPHPVRVVVNGHVHVDALGEAAEGGGCAAVPRARQRQRGPAREEPLVRGFAWSRCELGASFAIVQRKKGWWQAEVRLGRWKVGSRATT